MTADTAVSYTHLDVYKRQPFNSASYTITLSFPMASCKERPLRPDLKIFFVQTEVYKIKFIFILACTAITEIVDFCNM